MPPATLANILQAQAGIEAWCRQCQHHAVLSAAALAARLGDSYPVPEIGRRCRCRQCGALGAETRPRYPDGQGVIAQHQRLRGPSS